MTFSAGVSQPSVPIGSIVPFHKDFDTSVSLPPEFKECDGTTINDADSPLDGQSVPDLQGQNRHIRANSTTGSTGGASAVSLSTNDLPSHNHSMEQSFGSDSPDAVEGSVDPSGDSIPTTSTGGDGSHNNEPPFFDTVMAMRIK